MFRYGANGNEFLLNFIVNGRRSNVSWAECDGDIKDAAWFNLCELVWYFLIAKICGFFCEEWTSRFLESFECNLWNCMLFCC